MRSMLSDQALALLELLSPESVEIPPSSLTAGRRVLEELYRYGLIRNSGDGLRLTAEGIRVGCRYELRN